MNSGRTGPLKIKRSEVKGGRSSLWENGRRVDSEEVAKGVSYAKKRWASYSWTSERGETGSC